MERPPAPGAPPRLPSGRRHGGADGGGRPPDIPADTPDGRRFGITATLSPAFGDGAACRAFAAAGATRLRVNASHADPTALRRFAEAAATAGLPVVFDLQGSKARLGRFIPFDVKPNVEIDLVSGPSAAACGEVPVPHPAFLPALREGAVVRIRDGRIEGVCVAASPGRARIRIRRGGRLEPRQGVAAEGVAPPGAAPALAPVLDAASGLALRIELALSYAESAEDLAPLAALAPGAPRVAKLETPRAVAAAESLLTAADECWLCRGDLGAAAGLPALPELERRFRAAAVAAGRPWTMAGEVLHPVPPGGTLTRTEAVYVAGLVEAGAAGIVLSDETIFSADPFALVADLRAFVDALGRAGA